MRSMFELADNFPAGFWACDDCESDIFDNAPECGMAVIDRDIQYITDLSVTHCTRCDYEPETGLIPLALDYM